MPRAACWLPPAGLVGPVSQACVTDLLSPGYPPAGPTQRPVTARALVPFSAGRSDRRRPGPSRRSSTSPRFTIYRRFRAPEATGGRSLRPNTVPRCATSTRLLNDVSLLDKRDRSRIRPPSGSAGALDRPEHIHRTREHGLDYASTCDVCIPDRSAQRQHIRPSSG